MSRRRLIIGLTYVSQLKPISSLTELKTCKSPTGQQEQDRELRNKEQDCRQKKVHGIQINATK